MGNVAEWYRLFGDFAPTSTVPLTFAPPPDPTPAQIERAKREWNSPSRGLEWQREAFARTKNLPPECLEFARPHPRGLRFPVFRLVPRLELVGVVFRRKGIIPGNGPKALTMGFRGLFIPPFYLRPGWAWKGKGEIAPARVAVVCESPQAALKVALGFDATVLGIATLGMPPSRWQEGQISALGVRTIILADPDAAGKVNGIFLDTDPLTPEETRQALERYISVALGGVGLRGQT